MKMTDRRRLACLGLMIVSVATVSTGTAFFILYDASYAEQEERLVEAAQMQAELVSAVASFDIKHSRDTEHGDAPAATVAQLRSAHTKFESTHAEWEKTSRDDIGEIPDGETIASLNATEFDAVVTDIFMPGADGLEVLLHIRQGFSAPVLAMSADPTHLRTAEAFGAVAEVKRRWIRRITGPPFFTP